MMVISRMTVSFNITHDGKYDGYITHDGKF